MRLKYYFFLTIISLIPCLLFVIYNVINNIIEWPLILVIITIGLQLLALTLLYNKVIKNMERIHTGMDLIKEQDFSSRLKRVNQWEADKVVDTFNKMMEQLKNERLKVREQNAFLDLLITASPMGVMVLNYEDDICQINPAACHILGIDNAKTVLGTKLDEHKNFFSIDLSSLKKDETRNVYLSDGNIYRCSRRQFIDRGFYRTFYLLETITNELRTAEKKAYEKVIRMIAHETNNTIAGINSTLNTVKDVIANVDDISDVVDIIQLCINRCDSMGRFVNNFANVVKIPDPILSPVYADELLTAVVKILEPLCIQNNITIEIEDDLNMKPLMMDATLMEQVFINIMKNSIESIGQEGGRIIIRTDEKSKTISIEDNGKGIAQEVSELIFNPFFSTKPNGQGLGLIFIQEVLKQHQCNYTLKTDTDGWTKFTITFRK